MKVLYLTLQSLRDSDGVTKKVYSQLNAIESLGHTTGLVYNKVNGGNMCTYYNSTLIAHNLHGSKLYNTIYNAIKEEKYEVLYLRYVAMATPSFLSFIRKVKNLNIITLLEIPTYPYDGEFQINSLRNAYIVIRERICRNLMFPYVDRFITTSDYSQIFGVSTLRVSNAISIVPPLHVNKINNKNSIKLTSVANIAFWHGYDRLIQGIANYYKNKPEFEVYLDIVGDGYVDVIKQLKKQVEDNKLQQYVHFLGAKDGASLDAIFEDTDLAIGCLGCHRKNIVEVKSLKNVEYAMRGIPFIYSENNTDFDNMPYVLKVPASESPIDINNLISFVQSCKCTPLQIYNTVKNMTWEYQFKRIFSIIDPND